MKQRPGTRPVSERHRFDAAALEAWLSARLPELRAPLAISQFEGGQSNPTFLLQSASGEYVLRKKPPGKLLPSAHAIDREFRILQALAGSDVPVPAARVYCDDESVIGTPFYVMDYLPGRIFTDPLLPGLSPGERAAIYDAMNDALARLHRFDWAAAGLADYGRTENFVQRQVARWAGQYEASAGGAPAPIVALVTVASSAPKWRNAPVAATTATSAETSSWPPSKVMTPLAATRNERTSDV